MEQLPRFDSSSLVDGWRNRHWILGSTILGERIDFGFGPISGQMKEGR
jgi:hypothetical protein